MKQVVIFLTVKTEESNSEFAILEGNFLINC